MSHTHIMLGKSRRKSIAKCDVQNGAGFVMLSTSNSVGSALFNSKRETESPKTIKVVLSCAISCQLNFRFLHLFGSCEMLRSLQNICHATLNLKHNWSLHFIEVACISQRSTMHVRLVAALLFELTADTKS